MANLHVLYDGYSYLKDGTMFANCSCTFIQDKDLNIIVDCMTAWDKDKIIKGLQSHGVRPEDINYAISTHGHSDHLGNLNLFTNARQIVGFTISQKDEFYLHPFECGEKYIINSNIEVMPTPGHTAADVSVVVKTSDRGCVVVAGDLFEKVEDIADRAIWINSAGSENPKLQQKHRQAVIDVADYIVPGHGPMFKVTLEMKGLVADCFGI